MPPTALHRCTYGSTTPTKFLLKSVIPHLGFEEIDWDAIQYKSNPSHLQRMYEIARKRDRIRRDHPKTRMVTGSPFSGSHKNFLSLQENFYQKSLTF
jgi:hypothetical protein